jgi:hypothetical protein
MPIRSPATPIERYAKNGDGIFPKNICNFPKNGILFLKKAIILKAVQPSFSYCPKFCDGTGCLTKLHLPFIFSFHKKSNIKEKQMQGKISMDLSFCQSENGFSLDELVLKLADVYERKAFSELLKMILQMVQEILMYRILNTKTNAMKCCDHGHLVSGRRPQGGFKADSGCAGWSFGNRIAARGFQICFRADEK